MEEIWKTIEPFPRYDISSERRVRNNKTGRILNDGTSNRVEISFAGQKFVLYVEKLMEEYFGEYTNEVWRTIPEYRGYEASTKERVRNRRTGRLLKIRVKPNGKAYVTLTDAGYVEERQLWYIMEITFGRRF